MPTCNKYVVFLPWVGFREEITIGPFNFWPYKSLAPQKIQDSVLLGFLNNYFQSFVDQKDNPVDTIVVCSFQNSVIQNIDTQHYEKIRKIIDSLIFTQISIQTGWSVLRNNRTWGPPGADLFELIADSYYPDKQDISFYSGQILHTGWKIGEVKFKKPWHVGSSINLENKDVLNGLGELIDLTRHTAESERVFRALEWYRLAHTNFDQVSLLSKLVMMMTAFEILLELPEKLKRYEFAKRTEQKISTINMPKSGWINPRTNLSEQRTPAFLWAHDFYQLRNKIVHEGTVSLDQLKFESPSINWLTQLIVADLVFNEILFREMYLLGLCGDAARETVEIWEPSDEDRPRLTESILNMHFGFNGIHQALGWEPEQVSEETPEELNTEPGQ